MFSNVTKNFRLAEVKPIYVFHSFSEDRLLCESMLNFVIKDIWGTPAAPLIQILDVYFSWHIV